MDSHLRNKDNNLGNDSIGSNYTTNDATVQDDMIWAIELMASQLFQYMRHVSPSIIAAVGVIGMFVNILTMAVYIKLGFSQTINISYVTLAIADLCSMLFLVGTVFCQYFVLPILMTQNIVVHNVANFNNMVSGWLHVAFSRTSNLLTALISLERCLCVTYPTIVKIIVTRSATKVVITAIFIIGCLPVIFGYIGFCFEWHVDTGSNRTALTVLYNNDSNQLTLLNRFAFVLYGAVYPVFSWLTVSVCTTFVAIKLKQSARWRKCNAAAASESAQRIRMSSQNMRVTKTIVIIAGL